MPKVLVSDKLSKTAVQIFKDNGVEVDYLPDLGKDKDKLAEELDLIRARGYAVDNEEIELGLRCVAVPIFNDQGRPVAAISISSSTAHLDEARVCETASAIKEVAYSISRKLGYEKS